MSPRSWTSTLFSFALAVLLVTWALGQFFQLLQAVWPLLAIAAISAAVATAGWRYFQTRDYW